MTSSRPYLLRALYEWIVDNGLTPYILIDAEGESVVIPRQYVENGKLVLNIGPAAVGNLDLGNEFVTLDARFGGNPMRVSVPMQSLLAIYARENGKGMVFGEEDGGDKPPPSTEKEGRDSKRPTLRVIK